MHGSLPRHEPPLKRRFTFITRNMGKGLGNVCHDFYSGYPASDYLPGVFGNVGIGGMIIGFVYFCSCAITIAWIRKQQHNALMGMEGAAKHVVFPIYLPIMWVSALSDAFVGLAIFFVKTSTDGSTIWPNAIITALALGIQHVVIEGLAVILMQYGCGMRAMRVAGASGGVIGVITFLAVLFYYRLGETSSVSVIIYFCWMLGLLAFYATLWLMPQQRLYRRPAVIFYAKFWTLFQVMVIIAVMVGALGQGTMPEAATISACMYNVVALPVFVVFKPFIMYTTLLMESKWWQGLLIRAPSSGGGAGHGAAGRDRDGRHSGSSSSRGGKRSRHPIRYIRSVEGLDEAGRSPGPVAGAGTGTGIGAGYQESDGYSSTMADAPRGFFTTMGHILVDVLRAVGFLRKGKYGSSSLSAYSDGSSGIRGSDTSGGGDGGEGFEREDSLGGISRDGDSGRESEGTTGSSLRASSIAGSGVDGDLDLDLLEDGDGESPGSGGAADGSRQPLLTQDRRGAESRPPRADRDRDGGRDRGCSSPASVPSGRGAKGGGGIAGALASLFSFTGGNQWGQRRGRRNYDQLKNPLLGVEVGFSEAQELAQEVDNITYEGTVKLLNFAYLSLDRQGRRLLGSGSFSKVYAGRYRSHPVAVKMLFTQDLNPDVIKRCSNEARILTEIAPHPNVVRVFGVAVLPPSVCLVLEICEYGSLSDVLRGGGDSSGATVSRPPLNLSYSDRMYLALGCARGLQALHAYSPMLCHRDIKSMNFLIDSQLNAKIADLDLGHQYETDPTASAGVGVSASASVGAGAGVGTEKQGPLRVGGSNMCIYWQAPEVLQGQPYTQRSDIHSLALVIWEIMSAGKTVKFYTKGGSRDSTAAHGGLTALRSQSTVSNGGQGQVNSTVSYGTVPYAECKSMAEVRDKIIKGYRPTIPSAIGTPGSVKSLTGGLTRAPDPILLDILQLGWHPEPHMRPDADFIVEGLTRCWRNSLHGTLVETPFLVDLAKIQEENFKLTVLQDYSSSSVKGFRGSNITMASSFLGASLPHHGHGHGQQLSESSTGSGGGGPGGAAASSNGVGSGLSAYSRAQGQQRVVRKPPSPEVIASLLLMKSEPGWSKLEDEGAYLVVTPLRPYFMLWATRKWTQLTGYLVNDVIAYDICTLLGPKADHLAFEAALDSVAGSGKSEHIMSTIYRRDGKPMQLSVHLFPVFDSSRAAREAYLESQSQAQSRQLSRDSSYNHRLSGNSLSAASAAVNAIVADEVHGRVSFSRCAPADGAHSPVRSPLPLRATAAAAGAMAKGAESAAVPANSACATPHRKPTAKYQAYQSSSSASKSVRGPIQASDHNHYACSPNSATAGTLSALMGSGMAGTLERRASVFSEASDGCEGGGEAERDPSRILERIYSPTTAGMGGAMGARRSTSNVYSVNSAGHVTAKAAGGAMAGGSVTPVQRSRAASAAGSTAGEDQDLLSPMEGESGGELVFESAIEEECAHRRVAYIAVQFSCIRDTNS